jgi:signal peptidase II
MSGTPADEHVVVASGEPGGKAGGAVVPSRHGHGRGLTGKGARAWVVLVCVTLAGLWADLASKYWAFETIAAVPVVVDRQEVLRVGRELGAGAIGRLIPLHEPVTVVPGLLDFTLVLNPGAVFGIGPGKRWFFMVFTAVALAGGMLLFLKATGRRDSWAHGAVGLLLAGGLGNLYDRMLYGCVRDFIHPLPGVKFPFGWTPFGPSGEVWPYVSNVADLLLIIGIGYLMVYLWRADFGSGAGAKAEGDA